MLLYQRLHFTQIARKWMDVQPFDRVMSFSLIRQTSHLLLSIITNAKIDLTALNKLINCHFSF